MEDQPNTPLMSELLCINSLIEDAAMAVASLEKKLDMVLVNDRQTADDCNSQKSIATDPENTTKIEMDLRKKQDHLRELIKAIHSIQNRLVV